MEANCTKATFNRACTPVLVPLPLPVTLTVTLTLTLIAVEALIIVGCQINHAAALATIVRPSSTYIHYCQTFFGAYSLLSDLLQPMCAQTHAQLQ